MKRFFLPILILALFVAGARAQTATSFSATVSTVGSTAIGLQGTVDSGTLTFGTHLSGCASCVQPTHGKLSNFNANSGILVYTPESGYTGSDSFGFTAIKDGSTSSSEATVTITVTSSKTTITDKLLNPDGSARAGKITFILTQPANSPEGLIPASATVTSDLTAGQFTVSLYPSRSLSPQAYYQMWAGDSGNLRRELLGIFDIPAATATITSIQPYRITDTNRQTRYNFVEYAAFQAFATKANSFGVLNNGTLIGTRPSINFIPGGNISLNIADNSGAGRVDVTISDPTGGSGGTVGSATSGQLPVYNGATSITGLAFAGANKILKTNTSNNGIEWATVTAGTGISVTPAAGSITIANTGISSINGSSGGAHTINAGTSGCGSQPTVTTLGATTTICVPMATATVGGYVTAGQGTQTIAGQKVFTGFNTTDLPVTVKQFPSGSSTVQEWQDSGGTAFARMTIPASTHPGLWVKRMALGGNLSAPAIGYGLTFAETNSTDNFAGIGSFPIVQVNNAASGAQGVRSQPRFEGTGTHTATDSAAYFGIFTYNGSGTLPRASGAKVRVDNSNTGTTTWGNGYYSTWSQDNGATTNFAHFLAAAGTLNGGTRGTEYGLYVESLAVATTNWGVYTAGTMGSSLGGFLDLRGRTAPAVSNASELRIYMDSSVNAPKASFNGAAYGFFPTYLTATATLDFPSTSAQQSTELTITVTGAAVGKPVWLGTPASLNNHTGFMGYVSATNTVTVRFLNFSSGAVDPASGSYTVAVLQ